MKDPDLPQLLWQGPQGCWQGAYRYPPGAEWVVHFLATFQGEHPFTIWLDLDGPTVRGRCEEKGLWGGPSILTASLAGHWDDGARRLRFIKRYQNLAARPIAYEGTLVGPALEGIWFIEHPLTHLQGTWHASRV